MTCIRSAGFRNVETLGPFFNHIYLMLVRVTSAFDVQRICYIMIYRKNNILFKSKVEQI